MALDDIKQKTRINTMFYTGFCTLSDDKKRTIGGGKRDRTADPLHAMQVLSQLSYTPKRRSDYSKIWELL